ncbi:MAG: DUF192 domain-containing protein [Alphaproteobacteria bacterium]|nr:DUF192 domain-containing protein [Alphaproteobacteria bacterium]MCB9794113.1 DUF192 domain-containing protein [Alphaproteobacteria bacterium]
MSLRAVEVRNLSRGVMLAAQGRQAESAWERMRGLLGTDTLPEGEAMVIAPCNSVHSFFMRYPFDVIFADADQVVRRVVDSVPPWRMTTPVWGARYAIELPAGTAARCSTQPGDQLEIRER